MARDKRHDEALVRWAEFVRSNEREKWKKQVDVLINSVYQKSRDFYSRMQKTENGREILRRLREEKIKRNL